MKRRTMLGTLTALLGGVVAAGLGLAPREVEAAEPVTPPARPRSDTPAEARAKLLRGEVAGGYAPDGAEVKARRFDRTITVWSSREAEDDLGKRWELTILCHAPAIDDAVRAYGIATGQA